METLRDIVQGVENEGLDYYFNDYISIDKLPEFIKPAVQKYLDARKELMNIIGE